MRGRKKSTQRKTFRTLKRFKFPKTLGLEPDVRTQIGALCYRMSKGKPEILLITSRDTGRWVIPKGWPIGGKSPWGSAEQEAWEEAGVTGRIRDNCLGTFGYVKYVEKGQSFPCQVVVYPLRVKKLSNVFPEAHERKRKWFTPKKAAARVDEPELKTILRGFDPAAIS